MVIYIRIKFHEILLNGYLVMFQYVDFKSLQGQ